MAQIAAAQYLYDEEEAMLTDLRELVEDDDDQGLAEDFRALRSKAAPLENAGALSHESWDWVENGELIALRTAEMLAREAADIQRALSLLSRRSGPVDEAFVAALRRQAVSTAARRADAEGFITTMRRIREKELRRLAAAEHPVHPDTVGLFLAYIARETGASQARGEDPIADELALAPLMEVTAVSMEERTVALAGRLRRGAAEFAARHGEEELVAELERHAATAEAVHSTAAEYTASVRRFRAACGSSLPPAAEPGHAWSQSKL